MAKPSSHSRDHLYPSLLDRLAHKPPHESRGVDLETLRESVLRDLNWLFNTSRPSDGFADYPQVARSVLNYGLPPLSGRPASSLDFKAVCESMRQAILNFEPRFLPHTVKVLAMQDPRAVQHNLAAFRIEGQLWALPVPLSLLLRTDIDLETGQASVIDAAFI